MFAVSQDLVNQALNLRPKKCNIIYSSLLQLLSIAKGTTDDDPSGVVQSALTASNSLSTATTTATATVRPLVGSESGREGRPRKKRLVSVVMERNGGTVAAKNGKRAASKCSFCKDSKCGNIQSCAKLKAIGRRLKDSETPGFIYGAFSASKAKFDPSKMKSLMSDTSPLLRDLPNGTKWLLVCGIYKLVDSGESLEENIAVQVSCYGEFGEVLPSLGGGTGDFRNRLVMYAAARDWISRHKGRIVIAHTMEGW